VAEQQPTPGQAEERYTCERCGRVKPVGAGCACGGHGQPAQGHGAAEVDAPGGWDPEPRGGGRPRLRIVAREAQAEQADQADQADGEGRARE
jgi:hypothetical protein